LRKSNPTPGAFEIPRIPGNNIFVKEIVAPLGQFCLGSQPVKVVVQNTGTNRLTNFPIYWSANNTNQTSYNYTGILDTVMEIGKIIASITLRIFQFSTYNTALKVWAHNTADIDRSNDTMSYTLKQIPLILTAQNDTICAIAKAPLDLTPADGFLPHS